MDAYNDILYKMQKINETIKSLEDKNKKLEATLSICVRKADLATESTRLKTSINNIAASVTDIDDKLKKVNLPSDTKYYLDETELKDIRNKIRQFNALMIRMEELEQSVIKTLNKYAFSTSTSN